MTLLCRFCTYTITWDGRAWVDTATDGDACDGYLVHEPASFDVACCAMCVAAIVNPSMDLPSTLTLVPAGMTPSYDPTDNGGWTSDHPCDTCGRTHMHTRRVITLTPERPNMPTLTEPAVIEPAVIIPEYAMHYESRGVDICTDCMTVVAHGPHPDDAELEHAPLTRVPAGYHVILGSRLIGEEEPWFSTISCDTCHSPLGGTRYPATLMSIEPVACQDCIDLVRHSH